MKTLKQTITVIASSAIFLISANSFSQDANQPLFNFAPETVQSTFQPYADAVSADLNSGLFHTAKVGSSFSIYLGVKAFGTKMESKESSLSMLPYATPQITIGSVLGTDVTVRYLPNIKIGNYGSVSSWGAGIRHSLSQYIKKSPIDVSAQFAIQKMTINDSKSQEILNASSTAMNLQVSKELGGFFTMYTGVQYESTKMNVSYTYETTQVNANFENGGKVKGIVGINLKLGPININGDCNFGKRTTYSAGFGLGF